jgi:DNA-binding CsgD family transcriptional regulator
LQLLADGCTVNELGSCLGFSAADIESLLANLFVVMGAATQTEAIAAANKRGLLNHESIPVRNTLELVKP